MTAKSRNHLVITLLAALYLVPFTGLMHLFDWDEINFAESAREMLETGNWLQVTIGYEPFWEKPPLFIWLQAISMKIFGVNEFAARFPNALCGIITFNLLYHLGCRIRNHFTGMFWVLGYAASLAPAVYYRSGIIDPVFNLFIFLAVYHLFKTETGIRDKANVRLHAVLVGIFAGLAFLTKGPVALLIIFLIWFIRLIINPRHVWMGLMNVFLILLFCSVVISVWVIPEMILNSGAVIQEFIAYQIVLFRGQIEWHNQPWFYHIVVLLVLCFPASVFSIPQLFRSLEYSGEDRTWSAYMRILFWVVLVLFSIVSTKIIHYSSLCWLPLGWFSGNALYRWHTRRGFTGTWVNIPLLIIGLLLAAGVGLMAAMAGKLNPVYETISQLDNSVTAIFAGVETNPLLLVLTALLLLVTALYPIAAYRGKTGKHPAWIFVLTGACGMMISAFVLPRAESVLQGKYISELKANAGVKVYQDIWGFKSYAHYFYGQMKPEDVQGPWTSDTTFKTQVLNPLAMARQRWLMDKTTDRNVLIFTRHNYQPDYYFTEKFELQKNLGAYKLWKRKDHTRPDSRL